MKSLIITLIVLLFGSSFAQTNLPLTQHPAADAVKDWRLGMQLWTFSHYTFFEALDKTASLGVSWVEAYPGQKLSNEYPDVKFNPNLPEKYRQIVKDKLKAMGLHLVNFGVVALPNDEAACRMVFDFAKALISP